MPHATCRKERAQDAPSLFQNGNLVFQTHHVGWIVAGFFTIVATVASFWLVNRHLQWYTNKREQRYIVRLLFMVPIYAVISLASFIFWNHSTPLILLRDCYESTVLTAFFYLLLMYLSPDPEEQKRIFLKAGLSREADREARSKGEKLKKWVLPLGSVKWKPEDGLYFLQLMKWGILQYCVVRPLTTLAAVVLDYMGLYCEESWGFGWGHVYIVVIVSISVTVAMYCLIQLYLPIARELAPHKPLLKLFAIKAVVFLTFWQATFLSVLSMFGVVKDTQYMTAADINIGIGTLLETFEMMIFAFLHLRAFTYRPYQPVHAPNPGDPPLTMTPRLRSLGHAMDFRETFREIWIGCVYIYDKFRGKEPKLDVAVRREAYYEGAFGRSRVCDNRPKGKISTSKGEKGKLTLPTVEIEIDHRIEVDVEGERQWLGLGNDYVYGLEYMRKERSEGLEEQIQRELGRRGYGDDSGRRRPSTDADAGESSVYQKHRSWWRSIYHRISQSGAGPVVEGDIRRSRRISSKSRPRQHSRDEDADRRLLNENDVDFDEPPPPNAIRAYRNRHTKEQNDDTGLDNSYHDLQQDQDGLAPLPVFHDHGSFHVQRREQYYQPNSGYRSDVSNPSLLPPSLPPPNSPPPQTSHRRESASYHPPTPFHQFFQRAEPFIQAHQAPDRPPRRSNARRSSAKIHSTSVVAVSQHQHSSLPLHPELTPPQIPTSTYARDSLPSPPRAEPHTYSQRSSTIDPNSHHDELMHPLRQQQHSRHSMEGYHTPYLGPVHTHSMQMVSPRATRTLQVSTDHNHDLPN